MTTMISEVYDAFIAAGADETHSRKAAEAIAQADVRFAAIELKLAGIAGEQALQRWMLGLVIAFLLALVIKAFFP